MCIPYILFGAPNRPDCNNWGPCMQCFALGLWLHPVWCVALAGTQAGGGDPHGGDMTWPLSAGVVGFWLIAKMSAKHLDDTSDTSRSGSIPEETLAWHLVSAASGQFEKCIGSLGLWVPNIATTAMESAFRNPFWSSRKHLKDIPWWNEKQSTSQKEAVWEESRLGAGRIL